MNDEKREKSERGTEQEKEKKRRKKNERGKRQSAEIETAWAGLLPGNGWRRMRKAHSAPPPPPAHN